MPPVEISPDLACSPYERGNLAPNASIHTVDFAPLGLAPGGLYNSIDIPPRWGCLLVHLRLFFREFSLCKELTED